METQSPIEQLTTDGSTMLSSSRSLVENQLITALTSNQSAYGHMFDMKAKGPIIIRGIDINTADETNEFIQVWTKGGTYDGFENQSNQWKLISSKDVATAGPDEPTSISFNPITVATGERRAFYVSCADNNLCLRYNTNGETSTRYQDEYAILFGDGITKQSAGWNGAVSSTPSLFSGALKYEPITPQPTKFPTPKPTTSRPTLYPTRHPTLRPSNSPTQTPSSSPVFTETITTKFDSTNSYAGCMWNVQTQEYNVFITSMAFNTDKKENISIKLYTREGSYVGHDKSLVGWTKIADVSVEGKGLDVPTYLPEGTFDEPLMISRKSTQSFYLVSDGANLRVSKGEGTGTNSWGISTASDEPEKSTWNSALIISEGLGKQLPMDIGPTYVPRVFNGLFEYYTTTESPSASPTVRPSSSPTTAMPTSRDFRLRLYWEPGYYWQETYAEMWYCMQCGSSGRPCRAGDSVYVEWCSGSSRQLWNIVGSTLRPYTDSGLCMTVTGYNEGNPIRLYNCDVFQTKQQFDGFDGNDKFELFPKGNTVDCLSQQHHPRSYETVYPEDCSLSRRYKTSYWIVY